jgi:hypothetical protein
MNHLTAINGKDLEYNKALDSSVDDGTMDLVELDSNRNIVLNKEKAVEQFFVSLYANFGVTGDGILQRKLREHVPIILITDQDGFYIYYMDTYKALGEEVLGGRWSEIHPYVYEDNNFIYKFTFGDSVTMLDKDTNELITGNYKELGIAYSDSAMAKEETFDTVRRSAIIYEIEKWMNNYINRYNNISYQFGITYQFWLPTIDKADWYRTIDDISMFVIFQNYPYYTGSLDAYNRYAFGGARIAKSKMFYLKEVNGIKYYHKEKCNYININGQENAYITKKECALEGAFPCPYCNP